MSHTYFSGRLRELREGAGISQKELADRTGLHLRTVCALESGRSVPNWETVLTLCTVLGVPCMTFTEKPCKATKKRPRGRPRKEPS